MNFQRPQLVKLAKAWPYSMSSLLIFVLVRVFQVSKENRETTAAQEKLWVVKSVPALLIVCQRNVWVLGQLFFRLSAEIFWQFYLFYLQRSFHSFQLYLRNSQIYHVKLSFRDVQSPENLIIEDKQIDRVNTFELCVGCPILMHVEHITKKANKRQLHPWTDVWHLTFFFIYTLHSYCYILSAKDKSWRY